MAEDSGQLRIGEFARRVGVTPELLRAWESRYGLTRPVRSPGGFRLYTAADAVRVERLRRGLGEGLSAAEAAHAALDDDRPSEGLLEDAAARLLAAIGRYDEASVHSVLDESLAAFGPEESLRRVVLPTLKEVGDAAGLRRLARTVPLALAGPGAADELSARVGARRLNGDLVAAADEVARA